MDNANMFLRSLEEYDDSIKQIQWIVLEVIQ